MHGSNDADRANRQVFVESAKFGVVADEMGIESAEISRHTHGATGTLDSIVKAGTERRDFVPHGRFA
jgi:hypothetical protein